MTASGWAWATLSGSARAGASGDGVGVGVGVVPAVNDCVAGEASTLPASSRARTENVYVPLAGVWYVVSPEWQPWKLPGAPGRSSLQSKLEWRCVDANVNDADAFVGPAGPDVIDVSGATVSTVNDRVAGDATFPSASIARTQNVYAPSASGPYGLGDSARRVVGPSRRPARRACTRTSTQPSGRERERRRVWDVTSEVRPRIGPPVSVVSGVPPTVNRSPERDCWLSFPAASVATTRSKYSLPFGTGPRVCGEVHG